MGATVKDATPSTLTFGIYPGSAIGDTGLAGPPDRPDKINQALARVFRPIAPASLATLVQGLLQAHRRDNLATAGLGHLPLVITEHGWPTGPGRTKQRQAEVLRTVIDVIARNAEELGIAGLLLRRRRAPVSVRADDRQLQAEARLPRLP
jgi:hypothetical protein